MINVVFLFLIGMAVLAIAGRFRKRGTGGKVTGKCPACGRHRIGKGPCPCGRGGAA
ncbi:hypothetical protein [Ovoidimarina sediminis]|uniref:hypothetical protein n=1 Tax=Ovoidimarina sediminis TaxID=3079856 RepID=UPI00290E90DE|nr:hypothetical protein [Rhodophyticola sp. MJ-SS7]MDU8944027.1 hypothetical protein [Rhodophyticola sp. MJ-SS7]